MNVEEAYGVVLDSSCTWSREAEAMTTLAAEVRRLQEIVARLPVTADGWCWCLYAMFVIHTTAKNVALLSLMVNGWLASIKPNLAQDIRFPTAIAAPKRRRKQGRENREKITSTYYVSSRVSTMAGYIERVCRACDRIVN